MEEIPISFGLQVKAFVSSNSLYTGIFSSVANKESCVAQKLTS